MKHLLFGCLINIGLFTYIVSASNSSVPATLSHDQCVTKCTHQLLRNFSQYDYHDCMGECVGDWPIRYVGGCQDINFLIQPEGPATCIPHNIGYDEEFITNPVTNETVGYFKLTWTPCAAGIQDLTGFYVSLQQVSALFESCQLLALIRPLTTQEAKQTRFSVVFLPKLVNSALYSLSMRSLPMLEDKKMKATIPTLPCKVLNEGDLCHCTPFLPAPQVTVRGYTVEVSTPPALKCHEIEVYDFIISRKDPFDHLYSHQVFDHSGSETVIKWTFEDIYNSSTPLEASIVLLLSHDESSSPPTEFIVEAWTPPIPNVTVISHTRVEVSFHPASRSYRISAYLLHLSKHIGSSEDGSGSIEPVSDTLLLADPEKPEMISHTFLTLPAGLYSVQVREERQESETFNPPEWGERELFDVPVVLNPALIPGILIPVFLVLCILGILVLVCLWREEKCLKILYSLPSSVLNALGTRIIPLRQRTVLIVWQADTRSKRLADLHAANVRYFAAFLHSICHFHVILDMWEEHLVNQSIDEWLLGADERADFVIFICPHYDEQSVSSGIPLALGDFHFMFGFFRNELKSRQRRRMITVRLPYSDPTSSTSSQVLIRMTRVFNVMDDIRSLYFHIQGVSPSELRGDIIVELINGEDYVRAGEGANLRDGIAAFERAYTEWMRTAGSQPSVGEIGSRKNSEAGWSGASSSSSSAGSSGSLLPHEDPMVNRLKVAPFFTDNEQDSFSGEEHVIKQEFFSFNSPPVSDSPLHEQRPHVKSPPPLASDSPLHEQRPHVKSPPPLASDTPLHEQRPHVEPPPPLVSDAHAAINQINGNDCPLMENDPDADSPFLHYNLPSIPSLNNLLDPDLPIFPYHDLPSGGFEVAPPVFDASYGQHSSAYGSQSSRSFHLFRSQSYSETVPKSPLEELNPLQVRVPDRRRGRSQSHSDVPTSCDSGFDSTVV